MKIVNQNIDLEKIQQCAEALADPRVHAAVLGSYLTAITQAPEQDPEDWHGNILEEDLALDWDKCSNRLTCYRFFSITDHDWITQQPETAADLREYRCRLTHELTFPKYPGLKVNLVLGIDMKVPQEDLDLYAMLGKIRTEEPSPSSPSQYLACEV